VTTPAPTKRKKKEDRKRAPQPEMLGRGDQKHGRWVVDDSPSSRGIPHTDLHNRRMAAPHGDAELDRAIRAHEMMHAKVSPGLEEFTHYVERGYAAEPTLKAVEEVRVNSLCNRVGIDVAKHLTDGSEKAMGKKLAEDNNIASMVLGSVGTAGTAGGKEFIKGVRSVDKGMAKVLANIQKKVVKQFDLVVPTSDLGKIAEDGCAGGFAHTERIAEWVDSLIDDMEQEREEDERDEAERAEREEDERDDADPAKKPEPKKAPRREPSDPTTRKPGAPEKRIPAWGELRIRRLPMPNASRGNLGKKRIASDMGRNPRRMHRYLTDRKVFDRTSKGMGGVVVIDASGSMTFEHGDIREIAEAAPGCTVVMYTERVRERSKGPNFWVLADKGRICEKNEMPEFRSGNVVDLPALKWATRHKQRSTSPIIWVSDCQVSGENDEFHPALNKQVDKFVAQERIMIVRNVKQAKDLLGRLKKNVGAGRPR